MVKYTTEEKKMQNFQAKFEGYLTLHYRPAQLYTNKLGWYIEYATLTDDQKSFRRKHIKLNRLRKKNVKR